MNLPTVHYFCYHYPPLARSRSRQMVAHALAEAGFGVKVVTIANPHGFFNRYVQDDSLPSDPTGVDVSRVKALNWWATGEVLCQCKLLADPNANWVAAVKRRWSAIAQPGRGMILGIYPPLADARLAVWAKQQTGWPMVLDYRDEMLDVVAPRPGRWRRKLERIERECVTAADLISVATPAIQTNLQQRYGLGNDRFVVVYTGYDATGVTGGASPGGSGEPLRIVYAGAISQHQKPQVLCDAYQRMITIHPEVRNRVTATFHGPENYYCRHVFARHLGKGLEYGGLIPHSQLARRMANYDVGFLSLADDRYAYAMPRKLFDYISIGLPILAALPDGEARDFIERHGIGRVARHDDADALAEAIYGLAVDPAQRAELAANMQRIRSEFSSQSQVAQLAATMAERLVA